MKGIVNGAHSIQKLAEQPPILQEVSTRRSKNEPTKLTNITLAERPAVPDAALKVAKQSSISLESPADLLSALRCGPDEYTLFLILRRLCEPDTFHQPFCIHHPGPIQAQIVHVLLEDTIPTFWGSLDEKQRDLLLACLKNVAGIRAIFSRMQLICRDLTQTPSSSSHVAVLNHLLNIANGLLKDAASLSEIWANTSCKGIKPMVLQLAWKELSNSLASGKILGIIAQSEDLLRAANQTIETSWLSSGVEYAAWLGSASAVMLSNCESLEAQANVYTPKQLTPSAAAAQIFSRALSLGYALALIKGLLSSFFSRPASYAAGYAALKRLLDNFPAAANRSFLEFVLRWISMTMEEDDESRTEMVRSQISHLSAATSLVASIISHSKICSEQLLSFLTDPALVSSVSFTTRRACISAVCEVSPDDLEAILEKSLAVFGDPLFINHAVAHQQESLAEVILLASGRLHRKSPMALLMSARSSNHMQGVSNRLESSHQRARWLGMVVGTALSTMVDKSGSRLNFGTDDMQTAEAKRYLELIDMDDQVGSPEHLNILFESRTRLATERSRSSKTTPPEVMPLLDGKRVFGPIRPPAQPSITDRITELDDDESEDDEDIKPYDKPDSDPEDSDEDATLVNRNKPRPPVYIRDLMKMLRDDKDHDRFLLGIKTAAVLIRRKTSFGSEVRDHAEELASILCNLQDPFDLEGFDEYRLHALIAVLLSDVTTIARWLSKQAFVGDYSLAQRALMLTVLGLGGRELAGMKVDSEFNPVPPTSATDFPSKRLPSRLHSMYTPETLATTRRLEAASKTLEHDIMQPLALHAADASTAHLNAVKVRTFSSRVTQQRASTKQVSQNKLAKIFAEQFFSPLVTRFQQDVAAFGAAGSLFTKVPMLLVTFLKTLALLMHASGPATLHLAEITTVFWDLLLTLQVQAMGDISILQAVLFGLLVVLESNEHARQRIVRDNAAQLTETQRWVELIFERTGGGELITQGSSEEVKVRTLAAGVLVKAREMVDEHQKRLMGGFTS